MKQVVFVVRDPGAYAAIYPVYVNMKDRESCRLFCLGIASKMNPAFAVDDTDIQRWVEKHLWDIRLLVCGTGFNTEAELSIMEVCRQHGICTVAILDNWTNYKSRFLYKGRFLWPNIYIVMDTVAREEAISEGVPPDIMEILGHPGLDEVLNRAVDDLPKYAQEVCEKVLLLGETMSPPWAPGYTEAQFFEDCIDVALSLGKKVSIKFHPHDDETLQKKYASYSVDGNLLDIAAQQDVIIGMTTIALLHCSLLGKITISYQPGLICEDTCIADKLGLSRLIMLREELQDVLIHPSFKASMKRNDLIWLDGKSTERISQFLERLIDS